MSEHPLKPIEKIDPHLMKHINDSQEIAFSEGALPKKFKLLIGLALDAAMGSDQGVKSFAQRAIQAGATKHEIAEVLRIVKYINGAGSMNTAARGIKDIFE